MASVQVLPQHHASLCEAQVLAHPSERGLRVYRRAVSRSANVVQGRAIWRRHLPDVQPESPLQQIAIESDDVGGSRHPWAPWSWSESSRSSSGWRSFFLARRRSTTSGGTMALSMPRSL